MNELSYGFVKVISGISKGRIGRYVKNDNNLKKAIISFSYLIDIIPYSNFSKFSYSSLTNNITKKDLINRYFNIVDALKEININGHRTIKKYSSEHNDLIGECTIIRFLLKEYYNYTNLENKDILILSSFKDNLWINDFALDLEERKINVSINDHELSLKNKLDTLLDKFNTFIFILSTNSVNDNWLKKEYLYLKERINKSQKIVFIKIDDSKKPIYIDDYYHFNYNILSDEYYESLNQMLMDIEQY